MPVTKLIVIAMAPGVVSGAGARSNLSIGSTAAKTAHSSSSPFGSNSQ